jgi:hypothetical protein
MDLRTLSPRIVQCPCRRVLVPSVACLVLEVQCVASRRGHCGVLEPDGLDCVIWGSRMGSTDLDEHELSLTN